MTYDEILRMVRQSPTDEWVHDTDTGISVLRADVDLRIEQQHNDEEDPLRDFHEEWANCHPDPSAHRVFFTIYYRATPVHRFMLVSVDGGRALLPLPEVRTRNVRRERYELARAVDTSHTLDDYLQRSQLEVRD